MIFFSSFLNIPEYRPAADNLFAALDSRGIKYELLSGANDIWLRDFMPVARRDGKYISFRYEPSYLKGYSDLRTDFKSISAQMDFIDDKIIYSDINLDGGNVVLSPSKKRVVISDRVYSENPEIEENALVSALENLLEAEVIIIPSLKSDMTGHADGMVRFVDENTVVGNDVPGLNGLEQRIKKVLGQKGIGIIDFPYYNGKRMSAEGSYLNFLGTDKYILLPIFGNEKDASAVKAAERIFGKSVVPVRINEIAKKGACLNCISWESEEDF